MTLRLMILNGPNLNMLGIREPHIYGHTSLADVEARCAATAKLLDATMQFHQSNYEGALVEHVQRARTDADALIINPAGLSFSSISLFDALKTFEGPIMEVHISNIHARDELHQHSIMSRAVTGVFCGLGPLGYVLAMFAAADKLRKVPAAVPGVLRSDA